MRSAHFASTGPPCMATLEAEQKQSSLIRSLNRLWHFTSDAYIFKVTRLVPHRWPILVQVKIYRFQRRLNCYAPSSLILRQLNALHIYPEQFMTGQANNVVERRTNGIVAHIESGVFRKFDAGVLQ